MTLILVSAGKQYLKFEYFDYGWSFFKTFLRYKEWWRVKSGEGNKLIGWNEKVQEEQIITFYLELGCSWRVRNFQKTSKSEFLLVIFRIEMFSIEAWCPYWIENEWTWPWNWSGCPEWKSLCCLCQLWWNSLCNCDQMTRNQIFQ